MHLVLENEHLSLGILPEVGGSISFFRTKTLANTWADIMRPATPDVVANKNPLGVGSFPLFPISNRIANAAFKVNGKEFKFKPNLPPEPHINHGDSWYKPWKVEQATADVIVLSHTTKDDDFPIKYRATQTFRLEGRRMTAELSLQNLHDEKMPFGFGMHPYFVVTPQTTITARTPEVWTTDKTAMPDKVIATPAEWAMEKGLNVNEAAFDNCFLGGDGKVTIDWPEHGCALDMTADKPMHNFVVYIPANHQFFCAELVSNATGALNRLDAPHKDDNVTWLKPGETTKAKQYFSVKMR